MPNGRCYLHGGKSLAGQASPRFRTGRYSKYLPARLQDRYQTAVEDRELLAMREDIALLDARIGELVERIDTRESGAAWMAAHTALSLYFQNYQSRRPEAVEKAAQALTDLDEAITRGLSDYQNWAEINATLEQRRKLVESERKRLVEMQQVITAERAVLLFSAFVDIIKRNVTDRSQLTAITRELGELLNSPEHAAIASGE